MAILRARTCTHTHLQREYLVEHTSISIVEESIECACSHLKGRYAERAPQFNLRVLLCGCDCKIMLYVYIGGLKWRLQYFDRIRRAPGDFLKVIIILVASYLLSGLHCVILSNI